MAFGAIVGAAACSSEAGHGASEDLAVVGAAGCDAARQGFEFRDDACKRKIWPSALDRDWTCPNRSAEIGEGFELARPLDQVAVDTTLLGEIGPDLELAVIVVRRDASGVPHYRYFSNGSHDRAFQPLSSTKFMAVANGASALRAVSNGSVGLPATVSGIPLGDLVTIIHTYNGQHYDSNSLARFFENVGGRDHGAELVHEWLGRPQEETFGGNYGAPAPHLPYDFTMADGSKTSVVPDDVASPPANHLSTLTMAEFLKRLIMHREDEATRLPGLLWDDVAVLLYGAEKPHWGRLQPAQGVTAPLGWGGMSADTAIYLQSAVDLRAVEARTPGQWRIFSKLGYGSSGFVQNSYGCFPELDADGVAGDGRGLELVISTHVGQRADGPAPQGTDRKIAGYYRQILDKLRAAP